MEGYGCLDKWVDPDFEGEDETLSSQCVIPRCGHGKVFDEIPNGETVGSECVERRGDVDFDGGREKEIEIPSPGELPRCAQTKTKVFDEIRNDKWGEDDDEEEETLSLSDLPVSTTTITTNGEGHQTSQTQSLDTEDFNFGSWGGSLLTESEMCAADEVFFQGQILPLRHSVSSESGVPPIRHETQNLITSMERSGSSGGVTTISSSRSNSTGSHTTTISSTATTSTYRPKIRNQFHSHPSPKPQIISNLKPTNPFNPARKSTIWGIFKVGLVRTPEIELQNKRKSVNSRSSSTSSSRKSDMDVKTQVLKNKKKKTERFLFESCRCSVDAVDTIIKKKKIVGLNGRQGKQDDEEEEEVKEMNEKQRKQALYHLRTFEWLKELSLADDVLEET